MNKRIDEVNRLLQQDEPGNISHDTFGGYTGYKPQSVIDAMNEIFGLGGWGFSEIGSQIIDGEKGQLAISQVEVWLRDVDFKPTSWGQSNVTRGAFGDARKGAQTDAIKKGLSYFSVGNRAYHGLLDDKPAQKQQAPERRQKQAEQQQQQKQDPKPVPSRLEALYQIGQASKLWDTRGKFLDRISVVLDQPITRENVTQLNDELLDLVEADLKSPAQF